MSEFVWERFPLLSNLPHPRAWITSNLFLSPNTVFAYARCLEDYLSFGVRNNFKVEEATTEHVKLWINELKSREDKRPNRSQRQKDITKLGPPLGLSEATIRQRLTSVRLYYDYLIEAGERNVNPVGRGHRAGGRRSSDNNPRVLFRSVKKLPQIPTEEQWQLLLKVVKGESLRTRFMFALQYDGALRREELCLLELGDFDFAHRTVRIRAETTKSLAERVVFYSEETGQLLRLYLSRRVSITRDRGRIFLSESPRNFGDPITIWTWSKVVRRFALLAGVDFFSTHMLRHLRLTDLARSGWPLQEITKYAGHRCPETTQAYIQLSGRDLKKSLERGMASIHKWRESTFKELIDAQETKELV